MELNLLNDSCLYFLQFYGLLILPFQIFITKKVYAFIFP